MFKFCPIAAVAAMTIAAGSADARTLTLDFTNTANNTGFAEDGNLVMQYTNVDSGVNATITAHGGFATSNVANHGQMRGDAQVNMAALEEQTFTLELWDAAQGSGFSTRFDPGQSFNYTLAFYDIDASRNWPAGTYDALSFSAEHKYWVSATTDLNPTAVGDTVEFTGEGTQGAVRNRMIGEPTQDQWDAAVLVMLRNTSEFTFTYGVRTNPGVEGRSGRNLVIDGNDMNVPEGGPIVTPLPAGAVLLLGGLGLLGAAAYRSSARRA